MSKVHGRARAQAGVAKEGLPKIAGGSHIAEMDDLRRMYAVMALRKAVRLNDGRTGVITRVDTDFPANETTLHVWVEGGGAGPGLAKVRAAEVQELGESSASSPG